MKLRDGTRRTTTSTSSSVKKIGGYIADIPDLQVCSAFATTPEEALAQVEIAKKHGLKPPG